MATWFKRKLKKVMTKDDTPISLTISTPEGTVTLSKKELSRYSLLHTMLSSDMSGEVGGAEGAAFLTRSGLEKGDLHAVWKLASGGKSKARLTREDFFVACKLIAAAQATGSVSMTPLITSQPLDLADFHYGVNPDGSLGGAEGGDGPAEFPDTAIRVTVSNPQTFGSGLDKHTRYQVNTNTSLAHFPKKEMLVWRRFSDFEWLNTRLSITFPAAVIPSFPVKRVVNNSDAAFLAERQRSLEGYLDKVARHPRLGTSLDVIVFLEANEAGLEAAKRYIEGVEEEGKGSMLEGVMSMVARGAGGGGGEGTIDTRPTPEFMAGAETHGEFCAALGAAVRAGSSAVAAQSASNAYLSEFAKACVALGELERKCEGVIKGVRAAAALAAKNAGENASVFGSASASPSTAFAAGAGAGGGAAGAPSDESGGAAKDAAAMAAFSSHSAHLASSDAASTSSISGMFATADFNDPYSSLASANAYKGATTGEAGGAPTSGIPTVTLTVGAMSAGGSGGGGVGGTVPATLGEVLCLTGNTLLECAGVGRRQFGGVGGGGAGGALFAVLSGEHAKEVGLGEAIGRRDAVVARVVEANSTLARKKGVLLGLKSSDRDFAVKSREAQSAVDKAELALKARREELGKMTEVLTAEMGRIERARRHVLAQTIAPFVASRISEAKERAVPYSQLAPLLASGRFAGTAGGRNAIIKALAEKAAARQRKGAGGGGGGGGAATAPPPSHQAHTHAPAPQPEFLDFGMDAGVGKGGSGGGGGGYDSTSGSGGGGSVGGDYSAYNTAPPPPAPTAQHHSLPATMFAASGGFGGGDVSVTHDEL